MAKIEASVMIDRPVEEVWKFVADLSNAPLRHSGARSDVREFRQTSPGPFGVGATLSFKRGRWAFLERVTEYEPNRKLVYEFISPGFMKGTTQSLSLETFEGKTRLKEAWDNKLSGFYRLLGPYATRSLRRDVGASLGTWKGMMESEAHS
jgi:uncharacterized protein YndB with AHSA1/START domain